MSRKIVFFQKKMLKTTLKSVNNQSLNSIVHIDDYKKILIENELNKVASIFLFFFILALQSYVSGNTNVHFI